MKKIMILSSLIVFTVITVFALDPENAKKAVMEQDYLPALMEYGFSEQQIKSWNAVGYAMRDYLMQLELSGRYTRQDNAIMMIQTAVTMKEITESDKSKLNQFLKDIEVYWMNELTIQEDADRQRSQEASEEWRQRQERQKQEEEAENQRRQASAEQRRITQEKQEQEDTQYARSFGLLDFVDGIVPTIIDITPNNFELAKKAMIIPIEGDRELLVQNVIDGYVMYSVYRTGAIRQVALIAEQGKTYPVNSQLDVNSVYKIEGTQRFSRVLGGEVDIIVISRLGPR